MIGTMEALINFVVRCQDCGKLTILPEDAGLQWPKSAPTCPACESGAPPKAIQCSQRINVRFRRDSQVT
jgi:hypothetical protein